MVVFNCYVTLPEGKNQQPIQIWNLQTIRFWPKSNRLTPYLCPRNLSEKQTLTALQKAAAVVPKKVDGFNLCQIPD